MVRVLKPGGIASFLTITYPPTLAASELVRAVELGSEEGVAGPGYEVLMNNAGFIDIEVVDVTAQYLDTLEAFTMAWIDEADGIAGLMGQEDFDERMQRRRNSIIAVNEGLHVRHWVTGRVPAA